MDHQLTTNVVDMQVSCYSEDTFLHAKEVFFFELLKEGVSSSALVHLRTCFFQSE